MVIRTIRETYRVIRRIEESPGVSAYLCAKENTAGDDRYIILRPREQELSKKMLPYFMEMWELPERNRPECLVECFVKEGAVWAVFRFYEGEPFLEKQKGKTAGERIKMGKALIEQLFTRKLPAYLQYEAANPSNITVSDRWGVRVNFLLSEPAKLEEDVRGMVQKRVADCFRILFEEELEKGASAELAEFVQRLEQADFGGDVELYGACRRLWEQLRQTQESSCDSGYLVRMWHAVFGRTKDILQFVYCVLIGGLCGLLVFLCVMLKTPQGERILYYGIGTLELIHREPVQIPETEKETEEPVEETEETEPTEQIPEETETTEKESAEMG